jgi:hypothetical protein
VERTGWEGRELHSYKFFGILDIGIRNTLEIWENSNRSRREKELRNTLRESHYKKLECGCETRERIESCTGEHEVTRNGKKSMD